MKRLGILIVVGSLAAVFIGVLPFCSIASTDSRSPSSTRVATLEIEKMTCGGCAMSVKMVVKAIDGVEQVTVSYEEKKAVVTYDPRLPSAKSIAATINEKLPYLATVLSDEARSE
jgi:copper chaperone CopZ